MKVEWIELQHKDYPFVKEIYDYYIVNTTVTFGIERISLSEVKETIPAGHSKYKSFIIKYMGEDCGFCYLSRYRKRQAYDRTAEITIYLKPGFSGKGIGKLTLEQLKIVALENEISVLIGIITAENHQSVALFEKCGFEKCAHFRKVGEKFGRILDTVAYQIVLDE